MFHQIRQVHNFSPSFFLSFLFLLSSPLFTDIYIPLPNIHEIDSSKTFLPQNEHCQNAQEASINQYGIYINTNNNELSFFQTRIMDPLHQQQSNHFTIRLQITFITNTLFEPQLAYQILNTNQKFGQTCTRTNKHSHIH